MTDKLASIKAHWSDGTTRAGQADVLWLVVECERLLQALSDIADTSSDARTVGEAREAIRQSYPGGFTSTFDAKEGER